MNVLSKTLKIFAYLSIPMTILVLIGKFCQPEYQMVFLGQGDMLGKNVMVGVIINLIFNVFLLVGAGLVFYGLARLLEREERKS